LEILVPKFGGLTGTARRTVENELRFGTWLKKRLTRERADTKRRMVAAAAPYRNVARRQMGELTLTGIIDARTYFRWLQTDPDFFKDKNNWKRFVKDNPEVQPWKG
jgi:hypothetical protein